MRREFAQIPHGASYAHFDIHAALALLPPACWTPADQARKPRTAESGVQIEPREGAWVAEANGLIDLTGWPPDTRLILRTERPHPGAQLRTTDADGHRITGVPDQHRARRPRPPTRRPRAAAPPPRRVEDRIRAAKDTGLRNLPFPEPDLPPRRSRVRRTGHPLGRRTPLPGPQRLHRRAVARILWATEPPGRPLVLPPGRQDGGGDAYGRLLGAREHL